MDWTIASQWISPKLGGVLLLCWISGYILKRTPIIPGWSIIYAVTAVGIAMAGASLGWSPNTAVQGVLCAAVAVYGNQMYRQTAEAVAGGEDSHGRN
ncbi:phage holin family protein [Paenibacillus humicus]|uniref:phage holin family protein n=1 Tax=Paenibacillus humicus TaxID=412861 RepID=UPI000FDA8987|nr:phage holin family protein [Paenibacillus humicus]